MTDEMLVAQAQWLPQYDSEIESARERLEAHERNGTRVKTMDGFKGVARLEPRTTGEPTEHENR
jgi:alpha-galactosidase